MRPRRDPVFLLAPTILVLVSVVLASACSSTTRRPAIPSEEVPSRMPTSSSYTITATAPAQGVFLRTRASVPDSRPGALTDEGVRTIEIDPARRFQQIEGFGYTLTGGSAMLLHAMSSGARAALLDELFGRGPGSIGVSYLRLSIGASDLDPEVFSYNDLPPGESDPDLARFSIDRDRRHLIPVLKEILAINPDIRLMGSPWSAPAWMKTNGGSKGGSLRPEHYDSYAAYFVRYIESMAREGITIDAITVQNEPLHPGNNPSMSMSAFEQTAFVRDSLGPAFEPAELDTKILIYDHNPDRIDYPLEVLADEAAARYIYGTAFHLYGGEIDSLSEVHAAHPDKAIYFTEQWVGAPGDMTGDLLWHIEHVVVGATRNWARAVLEWNLASDPNQDPHTPGGCTSCLGAITIDGDTVTRNPAYYVIAHASRFVPAGSVRIHATELDGLPSVAFRTPHGTIAMIVSNPSAMPRVVDVEIRDEAYRVTLSGRSVATVVWPGIAP